MTDLAPRNRAKEKLAAGELTLCMGLRQAHTADIAQIAAASGFDAVYVDLEHSPLSLETTSTLCIGALGAGITPLVRVPGHDVAMAIRVLDGGALGVIFPQVETAEQARTLAAGCRYPPLGQRSVMGSGPAHGYRALPLGEVNAALNADTLLIVMLETAEGIASAEAIAAVDGVDMLLIGANDLSTALGIPGELRHAKMHEAFATSAAACKAQGKLFGIGGVRGDLELQRELYRMGGTFIIAGHDTNYLMAAARADAAALRAMAAKP
jgi:4-hydroxy-2-oxoheptanedioate aldolase